MLEVVDRGDDYEDEPEHLLFEEMCRSSASLATYLRWVRRPLSVTGCYLKRCIPYVDQNWWPLRLHTIQRLVRFTGWLFAAEKIGSCKKNGWNARLNSDRAKARKKVDPKVDRTQTKQSSTLEEQNDKSNTQHATRHQSRHVCVCAEAGKRPWCNP